MRLRDDWDRARGLDHQLVAGFVGVQSGGVSSGTTARGFMNQGAKRTYSAPRLDSACSQRARS